MLISAGPMGNFFDTVKKTAFDVVTKTMGYAARWTPVGTTTEQTATVLYSDSTLIKYETAFDQDNEFFQYRMEYRMPFFASLKANVDAGKEEHVTIDLPTGATEFWVRKVRTLVDGDDHLAYLQKLKQ